MTNIISIYNLSKAFDGKKLFQNFNFTVKKNSVHALIGANGAGKTTLLRLLTGLYEPDEGKISVSGKHAMLLENDYLYEDKTGLENLKIFGLYFGYYVKDYKKYSDSLNITEHLLKQDYGHQAVAVMLSCWYTSEKIINTFAAGGFHTIGALKTNRMLYPFGFKKKLNEFAAFLTSTRSNFRLVTVKKQKYYVYRYEGKLNGIENAVVLLSYPEKAFGNPKALRAFLSTDVSLSLDETLSYYVCR